MKVTSEMLSLGGTPLSRLADFEDQNGNGIQAANDRDEIRLATDSYNPLGHVACLSADDADALGHQLIELAGKAKAW